MSLPMTPTPFYPVGTPGTPWNEADIQAWRARLPRQRSHADDVVAALEPLRARYDIHRYGEVVYDGHAYPLLAVRSRDWRDDQPVLVVTGGVHGYETSGVHGALEFLRDPGVALDGTNLLVVPCVSPWAYEHIQRWNFHALDPNRNFRADSAAAESAALVALLAPLRGHVLMHIDLHETTDTDESEFRPALAARDGKPFEPGEIQDGFYLVDDIDHPQPAFQRAVIDAVARVTHIAEPDAQGRIIGEPLQSPGVIEFPVSRWNLCAAITGARFATTTEVYPDSPRTTPAQCNAAQVAAIRAAINEAMKHRLTP
ncbi:DUF2817 domain-containing protein [Pelomonas baiyunensis]|uniref:DUF2817 domain-containing protein n=1 Tax=Pelomonas baiyunensis TaxID=3299026 RepID=A0ABW7H305_9BURK